MAITLIVAGSAVILLLAYRLYGRYIARRLGVSNENVTPAHTHADGVDYVASRPVVVLGHHFASIAGAGPIVGPVIAVAFGWIPALIWILVGGIFFGAVHDLTAMIASLRHQGKSIGEVIQRYIGPEGKRLFLLFSFATLVLVIAVFADIVAKTFVSVPEAASASVMFVALAILFGQVTKRTRIPFWIVSVAGVALMYLMVWLGTALPMPLGYGLWIALLFAYVFLASVMPVSLLLQPRDYLNSFLLYGLMIFGLIGVFVARPTVIMDSSINFEAADLGYLFPVLFVTVACGAISGFHSLVASGTTSKQLDREEDARLIGFGGMLIETLLAVLALTSVLILSRGEYVARLSEAGPVSLFAEGIGGFIATLGIPRTVAVSFVGLTVSAFALTTLDTCTRLARYTVQEYFEGREGHVGKELTQNRYAATTFPIVLGVLLVLSGEFGTLWPIFGSANQMLGAIALLAVSVWLIKKDVKPVFTLIPMTFMFCVTLSSLGVIAWRSLMQQTYLLAIIAIVLGGLALVLLYHAHRCLREVIGSTTSARMTVPGELQAEVRD